MKSYRIQTRAWKRETHDSNGKNGQSYERFRRTANVEKDLLSALLRLEANGRDDAGEERDQLRHGQIKPEALNVDYWRARATRLRKLASVDQHPAATAKLEQLALECEQLAGVVALKD